MESIKRQIQNTLYVTDLDGTLMRRDETISGFTVQTLNRLIEEGMHITYATARSFHSAYRITRDIRFTAPVITRNGGVIADQIQRKETEILRFSERETAALDELLTGAAEETGFVTVYVDGEMTKRYLDGPHSPGLQKYLDFYAGDRRMRPVRARSSLFDGVVTYVTLISERDALQPVYERIRDAGNWECVFQKDTYGDEFWLEVCPPGATKAKAIMKCRDLLGCDRVVAFGDSPNDLSMFAAADEAFAVENADPDVKAAATAVIPGNERDGVALYLAQEWEKMKSGV